MLTTQKLTGNPNDLSEYHFKEENYYFNQAGNSENLDKTPSDSNPTHVHVYGGLCPKLGLQNGGEISKETFSNLLSGKNSHGEKITKTKKVFGIDLTFSAPKSVSIAGLLSARDPKIIQAHDQAVLETIQEIEKNHAHTRLTKDTKTKTGNMVFVTVRDGFNREHEPHLHTHTIVMNMTQLGNKVLALDGREIMSQDFNKFWGAMYRTKLAGFLKEAGYRITYLKKGEWRMDCVSPDLEDSLSTRRKQILKAKAKGLIDMDAWRKTRKEKNHMVALDPVQKHWRDTMAAQTSDTGDQNRRRTLAEREKWMKEALYSIEAQQEREGSRHSDEVSRWVNAGRRASSQTGCPSKESLYLEYLVELARSEDWASISYAELERRFETQVSTGTFIRKDDDRYATWELVRVEREWLEKTGSKTGLCDEKRYIEKWVNAFSKSPEQRKKLSTIQQDAVLRLLSSNNSIIPIQGDAGSGKTTMLRAIQVFAEEHNIPVMGLAMQGVAAQNLEEESGIKSGTLASFIGRQKRETVSNSLLVIDEASMMDSRSFSKVLQSIDLESSKVVLVGDVNQLESIGAGRPFDRLIQAEGSAGEAIRLTENFRQRDERLRAAVDLARKGRMRESLDMLDEAGKIIEITKKPERLKQIAELYDEKTLILTGTTNDREVLNEHIREGLVKSGELDTRNERALIVSIPTKDGTMEKRERIVAPGEMIVFLKNEYKKYDLRNGERGTVKKVGPQSLRIELEENRTIDLDLADYSSIDYGYALTTYKAQGLSFDKVVVEADTRLMSVNDMRHQYVNITRARDEVLVFTDNKEDLNEYAGVRHLKRDTLDDKSITLEMARDMESRLKERAGQAAQVKIDAAGEFGRAAGRKIEAAAQPEADFTGVKWITVDTPIELKKPETPKSMLALIRGRVEETEIALNENKSLNNDEKKFIGDYLSGKNGETIFRSDVLSAEGRICAALVLGRGADQGKLLTLPAGQWTIINRLQHQKTLDSNKGHNK